MKQKIIPVNAISRSIDILVGLSNGFHKLTDITKNLNMPFSTVHRMLKTMEKSHLVFQDPIEHHYYLGPLILQLASKPQKAHYYLISIASEEMKQLAAISGETINLTIMMGAQIIQLFQIHSNHPLRVHDSPVTIRSISGGSIGKVLLSQQDDNEINTILRISDLEKKTENSITDKETLMEHVRKTRQEGYAISYGEWIQNSIGISAPITNYPFPCALSVVGPRDRMELIIPSIINALTDGAKRISTTNKVVFQ